MKVLLIFALAAASAVAQVPDHSLVSGVTIDVADISLPVTYGAAENHAVFSACTPNPVSSLAFTVDYDGAAAPFYAQVWSIVKTDSGYCTSVVAPVPRVKISSVVVDQMSSVQIIGSPTSSASAASRSRKQK